MRSLRRALGLVAALSAGGGACASRASGSEDGGAPVDGSEGDGPRGGDGGEQPDAASGPDAARPAGIDFSIWSLQLPTGSGTSPTTIAPAKLMAGYSDAYFYVAADGGQAFMDPATGITTSGSQHCRTEMREDAPGGAQASWAATGTNVMRVVGSVQQVGGGAKGHVTVAQVFNGSDSIPLCELEYSTSKGGFVLLYEEAKGGGTTIDLGTPIALGAKYAFALSLSQGVLTVTVDDKQVYSHTPSAAIAAKRFYFKVGDYDQTASAGPISTTPYSIVEAYGVDVVHE